MRKKFKPFIDQPKAPGEHARLLVLDTETLPMSANTWGLWDQNIGLNQISNDWSICAVAGKLVGQKESAYLDTRDKKTARDDEDIIRAVCSWIHNADVLIGHNLQKFDIRKLRARAIQMGLPPFKEPKIIDTMKMAKSVAAFTSNKLEYLSKTLTKVAKSSHASYPGFELWAGVMRGEREAWDEMQRYNIRDIQATEALYLALRPWAKGLPNLAHYYSDNTMRCPRCGSSKIVEDGMHYGPVGEYQQYRCNGCGGLSHARQLMNSKEKRRGILAV